MKTNNGWQKCKHNKHWVKRTTHKTKAPEEYADHVPLVTFVVTIYIRHDHPLIWNCIGGIMASVFASSAIDRGFETRLCQTKNYKIGIFCFPTKHAVLIRKSKEWLDPGDVSDWTDMSTLGELCQWAGTIKT